MKKPAVNPYLPFWETIPDGEPYVFGNRLYVFGSHDKVGIYTFCVENYVLWSAPLDDLGDWTCEGTIYRKEQDPLNGAPYAGELPKIEIPLGTAKHPHYLYAPDVCKGIDGRYYLYYALDFVNVISVAVSDKVTGPYEFLDFVRREDGSIPDVGRWFDPAVLCEESGTYLYYGFAPAEKSQGMKKTVYPGAMMVQLASDMHTIVSEPICVANGIETAKGTDYEEHAFFEASSIRHYGEWYYLVYSSIQMHELCYGMARSPQGPFAYKGVIVSNANLGYEDNKLSENYYANNHGGLVEMNGKHYIFWHRHTHGTAFARQGCADQVEILEDGTILQTEITSCGLNQGPLPAKGRYDSYITCHLMEANREEKKEVFNPGLGFDGELILPDSMTYITEEANATGEHGLKPYIANMQKGSVAGFKYFDFEENQKCMNLELRGKGNVVIHLDHPDGMVIGTAEVNAESWVQISAKLADIIGIHALYFGIKEGWVDFASFQFI